MDLLITGATGFLGAQIAARWLGRSPEARVACVVRGADRMTAEARLRGALAQAWQDQGIAAQGSERVTVLWGELDGPGWVEQASAWLRGPAELVHCAANLSFREADRAEVWRANVDGTEAVLRALARLPQVAAFDYVSTAYVAGDREGDILEGETGRPKRFNNPYEESKWTAEGLVRQACTQLGRGFRVFRPSIIIADSVTHRMASASGFYKVAETLVRLGDHRAAGQAEIRLPIPAGATLDLVPVDVVVTEMLAVMALGAASHGGTFHLTSAAPLSLPEVLRQLTPMSGVSVGAAAEGEAPSRAAALVMRSLHHYLPYFSYVRRFARDAATARGVEREARAALDVDGLRVFVTHYMADLAAAA